MCVLRIFQTIRFDTLGSGAKSNRMRMNLEERHYNAVLRRSVAIIYLDLTSSSVCLFRVYVRKHGFGSVCVCVCPCCVCIW